jgi:hypothetical protein
MYRAESEAQVATSASYQGVNPLFKSLMLCLIGWCLEGANRAGLCGIEEKVQHYRLSVHRTNVDERLALESPFHRP